MKRLIWGIVALLVATAAPAGKLYKWTDDDGNVHYSDSIPSDKGEKPLKRKVKSKTGRTKEVIEPPPSEAELERRRKDRLEAKRERERKRERRREQAERDQRLQKMYTSVSEIEEARDKRLQAINGQIDVRRRRLKRVEERLDNWRDRAARRERSSQGDVEEAYQAIDRLERSLEGHRKVIEGKQQEKERVRQRYAEDIERFRELQPDQQTANR